MHLIRCECKYSIAIMANEMPLTLAFEIICVKLFVRSKSLADFLYSAIEKPEYSRSNGQTDERWKVNFPFSQYEKVIRPNAQP